MSNSVLEIRLTRSLPIAPDANVLFDEQTLSSPGIDYDNTTGIITFNELGQYSIKWWVSTETTLKGVMVFDLYSEQHGSIAPGCSPIKTGQISGFGVIDVETTETTLALVNRSLTDTVLSKRTRTKAYLLITPINASPLRVYRGNLSTAGSNIQVPLGNEMYFRLENNAGTHRIALQAMGDPVIYDYRRLSSYSASAVEGNFFDGATLSGTDTSKDPLIYNSSQEMYWVTIRVQNPVSKLWTLYEIRLFLSGAGSRATVWVNVIEEGVSY